MTEAEHNEKILQEAIAALPLSCDVLHFYAALVGCLAMSAPVTTFALACRLANLAVRMEESEPQETVQ